MAMFYHQIMFHKTLKIDSNQLKSVCTLVRVKKLFVQSKLFIGSPFTEKLYELHNSSQKSILKCRHPLQGWPLQKNY